MRWQPRERRGNRYTVQRKCGGVRRSAQVGNRYTIQRSRRWDEQSRRQVGPKNLFDRVGVNDLDNLGVPTASVAQPAIQGQWNRSNLYLLDGVINTELNTSAFIIPPIIDAMQEFKVQSHDDQAEYGSVLGGVVNVVTRSGTNQLHGSAWEFLRNDVFDARDHFKDQTRTSPGALRQNQFGAMISGPVLLPKLYNGRNRTFFTFAYEGWRFSQAAQIKYTVRTDA